MIKLEEICGYLPYGLKVLYEKGGSVKNIIGAYSFNDGHSKTINWILDTLENRDNNYWNFKPILRNLSDLTREIEHNGEKFVPYKMLEKEFLMEGLLEFKETVYGWVGFTDNKKNHIPIYMDGKIMPECGWGIIQKLFEWHFDVFSLIDRNLAIDINTLNE